MNLTRNELAKLFTYILNDLHKKDPESVSLCNVDDYYFKVWHKARRFDAKCPKYTIGSLEDDIEGVKTALNEDLFLSLDLQRLGAILTAYGRAINKPPEKKISNNSAILSSAELRRLFDVVLQKLDDCEIDELAFDEQDDRYCKIQHKDNWEDDDQFLACPPYTVESVRDDMNKLKEVVGGKRTLSNIDYERLGAVLTTLGAVVIL